MSISTSVNIVDAQGKILPMKDLIGQLHDKFAGLSDSQKMNAASTISGAEARSGMLTLIDAGPDRLNQLTESF